MNRYLPALPWAMVAIVGLLLWRSHDNAIREKARLEAATEAATVRSAAATARADSLGSLLPGLKAQAAHWEGEAAQAKRSLDSVRVATTVATAAAQRREREAIERTLVSSADVDEAVENLRAAAPVLVPLVDTLEVRVATERADRISAAEALRAQVTAGAELLASTEAALAAQTRRADAQELLAGGLRPALAAQVELTGAETARADVWQERARIAEHPSLSDRARAALPWVGLGVVVGVVISK